MDALAQKSVTGVGYKLLLVKLQEWSFGDLLRSIEYRKSLHDVGSCSIDSLLSSLYLLACSAVPYDVCPPWRSLRECSIRGSE
jgi:hypothetical protein